LKKKVYFIIIKYQTKKMDDSLHLRAGQALNSCAVHPVVIVSILDHFIRRNENEGHRVIGSLLGVFNEGVIEIRSCFPVPHTEGEHLAVDMDFHTNMLDLHHRVSPKEIIVGWYSTGSAIDENSAIIHDFYARKMTNPPIHMTVDTNLTNFTMSVKAYTNVSVVFNEKSLGSQFLPVPLEIQAVDAEKIGVDVLMKTKGGNHSLLTDLDNLEISIKKLESMLDNVSSYVNKVLENEVEGDTQVGRFLMDTVSSLPKLESTELERIFNNNIQDLLLVVYLANLTRTQLQLSEKLQRIV